MALPPLKNGSAGGMIVGPKESRYYQTALKKSFNKADPRAIFATARSESARDLLTSEREKVKERPRLHANYWSDLDKLIASGPTSTIALSNAPETKPEPAKALPPLPVQVLRNLKLKKASSWTEGPQSGQSARTDLSTPRSSNGANNNSRKSVERLELQTRISRIGEESSALKAHIALKIKPSIYKSEACSVTSGLRGLLSNCMEVERLIADQTRQVYSLAPQPCPLQIPAEARGAATLIRMMGFIISNGIGKMQDAYRTSANGDTSTSYIDRAISLLQETNVLLDRMPVPVVEVPQEAEPEQADESEREEDTESEASDVEEYAETDIDFAVPPDEMQSDTDGTPPSLATLSDAESPSSTFSSSEDLLPSPSSSCYEHLEYESRDLIAKSESLECLEQLQKNDPSPPIQITNTPTDSPHVVRKPRFLPPVYKGRSNSAKARTVMSLHTVEFSMSPGSAR
mmetsp:Transcript_45739/g.74615  ORF Transcript_45739/g.74615 Transcript_45739/m.74615 type:complete len:459 (+) Transcript_45739:103-1479(+)|eukprot:CAMPEP_0184666396 /NCGR_PEP_ID=MMETSP0308-20130426/61375_1 /TAXON_ID=38269 /ORGANISM="Gloeochaete witrockiana, Strain SAG 46.84" /LENGTH=458 /DNA_ID=CAMNT_0027110939 /DNA_START=51 /DNA_END=1427 /DNA_ORIENTATION=+